MRSARSRIGSNSSRCPERRHQGGSPTCGDPPATRSAAGIEFMLDVETESSVNYHLASMFEIMQLRCFVAVAEELHFGRAAVRLNMTQPPLSRQIQVLERIIDAPLLERTSRAVRLTPAGRSFLPEARRILKLATSASFTAKRIAAGKTGGIKI